MTQPITGKPARTGHDLLVAAVLGLWLALAPAAQGQEPPSQEVQDARIDGQLAAIYALNPHLHGLDIQASVAAGVVHLTGTVASEVERDLAIELARAVKGVREVRSELAVTEEASAEQRADREAPTGERDQLRRAVADASTSAVIRSKLQANQNTRNLQIAVETQDNVVTLTGEVGSAEERELAELLVRNAQNVKDVRNQLRIRANHSARY